MAGTWKSPRNGKAKSSSKKNLHGFGFNMSPESTNGWKLKLLPKFNGWNLKIGPLKKEMNRILVTIMIIRS